MENYAFLLLNLDGDLLGLAMRLQREGYKTYSWYPPESSAHKNKTGKGIIELVEDFFDIINEYRDKKDQLIIIIDDNSQGDLCDYLQSEGWKVIGSSNTADTLEHDRGMGDKLAQKLGLEIPPNKTFTDFNSAQKYLKAISSSDPETKLVFKADGVELAGGSKTYLSRNVDDMVRYLEWIERDQGEHNYQVSKFKIQTVIEGLEVDYSSWFNGEKFAPAVGVTYEHKRIHGLGAAQGCLGQVFCFGIPKDEPYFVKHMAGLSPFIKGTNPSEWAINNIISEKDHDPYFLEFTPRFGWDCTVGEMALLEEAGHKLGEFFIMLAEKKPFPKGYFPYHRYAVSVRLYSEGIGAEGHEIKGKPIYWSPVVESNIWLYNARMSDQGDFTITDNPIGVVTATGDTLEEATRNVYELLSADADLINTPDIFYSEAIGEGVGEEIKRLKEWGLLAESDTNQEETY